MADRALELQEAYVAAKEQLDQAKALVDGIKAEIIELSGGEPFQGRLLQLKRTQRQGSIDYASLFRFHEITTEEQNAYRRDPTTVFSIYVNPPETE